MAKVALLTAKGRATPALNRTAPTRGPMNSLPTTSPATKRPLARSNRAGDTSRGTTVCAAVSRNVSAIPRAKAATMVSARVAVPVISAPTSDMSTTMRAASDPSRRRRAPFRSASDPAANPASSHGSTEATPTMATANGSSVIDAASRGNAANRMPSPRFANAHAAQNRQNRPPSRCLLICLHHRHSIQTP